jgi:hypothetical protein
MHLFPKNNSLLDCRKVHLECALEAVPVGRAPKAEPASAGEGRALEEATGDAIVSKQGAGWPQVEDAEHLAV